MSFVFRETTAWPFSVSKIATTPRQVHHLNEWTREEIVKAHPLATSLQGESTKLRFFYGRLGQSDLLVHFAQEVKNPSVIWLIRIREMLEVE